MAWQVRWVLYEWQFSEARLKLSLGAQGLHRQLVDWAVSSGNNSLPNDPDKLIRIAGATKHEWAKYWPEVEPFWVVDGEELQLGEEAKRYCDKRRWVSDLVQRTAVPVDIRQTVFSRDGSTCVLCGATERLELDHIKPWSAGGPHTVENLRVLCKPCNLRRGAPKEYFS
jgi:hypothetical protein